MSLANNCRKLIKSTKNIEENEDTEGNEQGRNDELRTGSDEVLPSEESVSAGGIGETESNGGSEADVDSDSENGAVSESASGEQVGPFGKIYTQFKGKAKEAIAFLLERRDGEALGALHHPEIGDIDLVWGKEGTGKSDGFGLAKLSKYHPEVLDDLQEILNEMHVAKRSENRIQLESDTHQAAVRLTWDSLRKNWLLTAFEKKNSAFDNTTDTDETFEVGKQNDTATLQNTVFDSKDTNLSEDNKGEAEKVSEEPKNTNKIEDFGEHIEGARKDLYKELAKTFDNVTIQSLVELPFSKAFKMPDLAKLVNKGVLTEEEALTIKAMQIVLLSTPKPKLSSKYSYKRQRQAREVAEWAAKTYESIELIKSYIESGKDVREQILSSVITNKEGIDATRIARAKQLEEWNKGKTFAIGNCYTPNPIAVMVDLLKALNYKVGDKLSIDAVSIKSTELGEYYKFYDGQGNVLHGLPIARTYEDAFSTMLWHAKFMRGDSDAKAPMDMFSFYPKKTIREGTGKYKVGYLPTAKSTTPQEKVFDSKEEAEEFASKYVSVVREVEEIVGYADYVIRFKDSSSGFVYESEIVYPTKADAIEALKNEYEYFNEELNAKHSELLGEKGKSQNFYEVFKTYGKQPYAVAERASRTIVKTFATKEEAESYAAEAEKAYATYKEFMRNFVYFSAESSPRVGEDYRKGADVTPEQFSAMFGFRGVQFGNWTNDKDRQAALNQAYDAFMDLASVIGVSPRALSLNGELGIAFGARGGGSALAHYELSEVVINLTKTKGAGSLAHEWWHALDNYFSRQGGTPLGMATEGRGKEVRDKVKEAFKKVVNAIKGTEYDKRSKARGQYWGSVVEETARLFAEWVNQELSATGASNAFLSRGIDQAVIDRWIESRYNYSRLMKTIDENVTLEEFSKLPEALKGFPYPTPAEVAEMGVAVSELFDAIEEKEGLNGNIAMFQTDELEYGEELTPAQQLATASAVAMLENNGIEVVEATDEMVEVVLGQSEAEFSKKKRALETESAQKEHQPSAVSSADGAKILKNLDSIAKDYEENTKKRANTFLGDLGKVLGTKKYGSNSRYATFETVNGKIVTIRLADHNATVSNFDNNNESDGISIVVSAKKSEGIDNDGNAHIVEYYYNAIKLRKAGGKPLAEIVKSIKQALYSGEYIDNTGLAEREEVNLNSPQFHIVYHGTGTKFDAFDHSHMGEGEGAQAYGWGTYVTEVEGIGKKYAETANQIYVRKALEYEISRIEKDIDFFNNRLEYFRGKDNGIAEQTEDILKQKTIELEEAKKKLEESDYKRRLYTVEIPDDNGSNYLDYTNQIKPEQAERINLGLAEIQDRLNGYEQGDAKLMYERSGVQVYHRLSQLLGGDKQASEFLNSIGFVGIKYPAQYTMGGRSDNAKNYVIFNENDAKIVDRVEFMRTPNGTVYGWTIGGKVYLTKSGMNPNTPVHEYTHLWSNAMMQKNPKGWNSIKDLLRGTPVWNDVMLDNNYANIHDNEDLVASEVLSRLSGTENAKKLEAMAEQMLKESKGIFAKAEAISLIERMKEALNKFWNWVGTNLFGIDKFDSIEQVTDRVLWDMATGTDLSGVEYSDIVEAHYRSDKTAEKAVAAFKEHYPNAGEIVIFNSPNELYDFGRRLGESEEDINDYLKRVEDKEVAASYSPDLDKMLIFAWQHANHYQSLLHEYIHRAIDNLGGIKRFRVLVAFLRSVDRDLVKKLFKYYQPDQIDDELIAYTLQYAFTGNAIEDLKSILSDYAIEQLNEILNYIGYETGRDTATEIERFERHSSSEIFKDEQGRIRRNVFSYVFRPHSTGRFTQSYKKELEEAASRTRSEEGADRELEDLYRTAEEEEAYAERMRGYMRDKVNELAERMNLKIEVVEDASTLKGKKAKAKGFFNPRTGTITVVLPNNSSIADVESTVFHEAVAHYGLRQLFGDKFDKFLDEVYEFAEPEIRERIARMALRGGLDIRKATEEYLATLAEDTKFFESSPAQLEWFAKIKRAFIKMLRTIGLNYMAPRMSDNELRYFLWLSYENLQGKAMPIFKEAAQITKQQELGLDNYGQSVDKTDSVTDSEEVLYRKGETPREKYERVTRRPTINNDVKLYHNLWNRFVEAYQDKMQSLSALQKAVVEESGKPIKPHEDAYSAENRMSSENKAQAEIYKRDFFGPLMNVITSLVKNKKVTYQDIKDYLIAKHGLERNDHMAMRDAKQQALKDLGAEPERPTSYLDADYDAKQQAWEDWNVAYTEAVKTNYEANRQRDYAGLTGLTKSDNIADAEENCTKNGFITIICLYKFESYTNITS